MDPPLSFDVLSGFVSCFDNVHDSSFMDLSIFKYLLVFCDITLSAPHLPTSQVKEEIQKLLNVRFLSVIEYPKWLANVIPIPKKDRRFFGYNHILMALEDMRRRPSLLSGVFTAIE
ncbi:hypothetical protein CK203_052879 [Vitis vinifera]|uniref:Uncharacterized protein n=1 Tax=Vitis vinifera TaxID=29760 RepID=A0A438H7S8_VITVI|nr:hypothetical protein CK203_052879 [Vitis vinifera]